MATTGQEWEVPKEFIVEEVVCEEELQKRDYDETNRWLLTKICVHLMDVKAWDILGQQDWQEQPSRQACSVGHRVGGLPDNEKQIVDTYLIGRVEKMKNWNFQMG